MSFGVVIPSKNIDNLRPCVEAILEMEQGINPDHILVVDDTPTDAPPEIWDWCREHKVRRIAGHKPFIFARNANLGLRKIYQEHNAAILLNDDAILKTRGGFSSLYLASIANGQYGIISAATNVVGNSNQFSRGHEYIRREHKTLCFVCVLITRGTWDLVGPLDEAYCLDYGVEDGDYCYRARKAGKRLGVYDRVFVDHGSLTSTYRGKDGHCSFEKNMRLFEQKHGIRYESQ